MASQLSAAYSFGAGEHAPVHGARLAPVLVARSLLAEHPDGSLLVLELRESASGALDESVRRIPPPPGWTPPVVTPYGTRQPRLGKDGKPAKTEPLPGVAGGGWRVPLS
jgi:hypothetical protein